jgi:LmbE family N-acetylglucosaminyl deacetylase
LASTLKLLAVFAHPDDESMGVGGMLAKYSAEGVETYYVRASHASTCPRTAMPRGGPSIVT